jgi:multidrug efflux pump subunit AcrB
MAFENFGAKLLASKAAGTSGFSQFLKFENVFKQAKMLQQAKERESARDRLAQDQRAKLASQTRIQTAEIGAGATLGAATIRAQFTGLKSPLQVAQKASQLAKAQMGVGAFERLSPDAQKEFVKLRDQIATDAFRALGVDPAGIFGLTLAKIQAPGQGVTTGVSIDQEIDDLNVLRPEEIADREF